MDNNNEEEQPKYPHSHAQESVYEKAQQLKDAFSSRERLAQLHDFVCLLISTAPDELLESVEMQLKICRVLTTASISFNAKIGDLKEMANQQVQAMAEELLQKATDDANDILNSTKPFE